MGLTVVHAGLAGEATIVVWSRADGFDNWEGTGETVRFGGPSHDGMRSARKAVSSQGQTPPPPFAASQRGLCIERHWPSRRLESGCACEHR